MSNIDGLTSTFRGGVSGFLGHEGTPVTPLPGSGGGSSNAVVMDNLATVKYPTAPQTTGVWYGAGTSAQMIGTTNVVLGNNATATGANVTVVGTNSAATSSDGTAIGYQTNANIEATAVGTGANAQTQSVAVGYNSNAQQFATAVGYEANAQALQSVAIGHLAFASKFLDIAIGSGATTSNAPGSASVALALNGAVSSFVRNNSDACVNVTVNGTPYKLLLHT
jgi:hypothetical protein